MCGVILAPCCVTWFDCGTQFPFFVMGVFCLVVLVFTIVAVADDDNATAVVVIVTFLLLLLLVLLFAIHCR